MEQIIKHFTPPAYTDPDKQFIEFIFVNSEVKNITQYQTNVINQFLKESGVIAKIEQIKTVNESLADQAYIKQRVARLFRLYFDWAQCVLQTCHLLMYEQQGVINAANGQIVDANATTYKTFNQVIVRALQCHEGYYHLIEQTVDEQYPMDVDFTQASFGIKQ